MQPLPPDETRFIRDRAQEATVHNGPARWQLLEEEQLPDNWWERWRWPLLNTHEDNIDLLAHIALHVLGKRTITSDSRYEYLILRGLLPREPITKDELTPRRLARIHNLRQVHLSDDSFVVAYERNRRHIQPDSRSTFTMGKDQVVHASIPLERFWQLAGENVIKPTVFGIEGGLIADTWPLPPWWDNDDQSIVRIRLHPLPTTV